MAGDRPKIHSIAVELSAHCNQKCDYCYNGWRGDDGAALSEPTAAQLLGRCARLLDLFDVDHFTLTGGEPLARVEVWPLLDLLCDRGAGVQIISNGGLVTDRVAERLAGYPLRYVQVTLNGPDAAMHGEHVGEGHFERTLRGIDALSRHGVPIVGCVVVTRLDAPVLGRILELWESLGVRHVALSRFSPAGYAAEHAARLLPSRGDILTAFDQALPFARRGMRLDCTMPIPPCMMDTADYAPIAFGCCPIGTSMQELALGPDGRLRNCTLHEAPLVDRDVLDDPDLAGVLAAPERTRYREGLPEFCQGCLHAPTCGGGCGAAALWMLGLDHARSREGLDERRLPDPFLWQHVDDAFAARLDSRRPKTRLEVIS